LWTYPGNFFDLAPLRASASYSWVTTKTGQVKTPRKLRMVDRFGKVPGLRRSLCLGFSNGRSGTPSSRKTRLNEAEEYRLIRPALTGKAEAAASAAPIPLTPSEVAEDTEHEDGRVP
jgi:hypothetical protein